MSNKTGGPKVIVHWTWNGQKMSAKGFIYRYGKSFATVELTEEVRRFNRKDRVDDVWTPGCRITVPEKGSSACSRQNCYELV